MKNKKIIIILIDILVAALIAFCIITFINNNDTKKEENKQKEEKVETSKIVLEFNEKFSSENPKIIYLASSKDGYSTLQTPIIDSVIDDYNLDALVVKVESLTNEEYSSIFDNLEVSNTTCNILVVKENKVLDATEGFVQGKDLVNFLINNKVLEEGSEYLAEKDLTIINYNGFIDLYNSNDAFVVTLGQTTCSHCIAVKPVLSYVAKKHNIVINYLNLTDMSSNDYDNLEKLINNMGYTESIGTPFTMVIKNKKIVDYLEGEASTSKFVKLFEKTGIITE